MKHLSRILYHNLTLLAITSLLWGALAISPAVPARAATLTVNTLSDENDHSCSDGDCSLRDAIESAAPGDESGFAAGLSGSTGALACFLRQCARFFRASRMACLRPRLCADMLRLYWSILKNAPR